MMLQARLKGRTAGTVRMAAAFATACFLAATGVSQGPPFPPKGEPTVPLHADKPPNVRDAIFGIERELLLLKEQRALGEARVKRLEPVLARLRAGTSTEADIRAATAMTPESREGLKIDLILAEDNVAQLKAQLRITSPVAKPEDSDLRKLRIQMVTTLENAIKLGLARRDLGQLDQNDVMELHKLSEKLADAQLAVATTDAQKVAALQGHIDCAKDTYQYVVRRSTAGIIRASVVPAAAAAEIAARIKLLEYMAKK